MTRTFPSTPSAPPPRRIYPVAARTPLVRLDPVGRRRAGDLPQARDLSADRLVQDPRRDERRRAADRRRSSPRASGRSAPATRRRASRSPRARPARARRCSSWTRAPATKLAAIERLGATIVKAPYDECWRDRRDAPLRSHARAASCIRSTTTTSSAATARSALEILEDLPDVDAVIAPIGGGGLLAGIGVRAAARCGPTRGSTRAEPETAAPLAASFAAGRASPVRRLARRRSSTAPAASPCCRRCGRCCRQWVDESIVVSLDEAGAGDAARRRARATSSPKARRPARSPRRCRPRCAAARPPQDRRRRLGRQHRSLALRVGSSAPAADA